MLGATQTPHVLATDVTFETGGLDSYLTLESGILTLSRWGGEATLRFGLPIAPNSVIYQNGSYVELSYAGDITAQIYSIEKGLEYMIVFNKKVLHINHNFPISSPGLEWYYQPPLTEELIGSEYDGWTINETHAFDAEGELMTYRPIDVVGSYAVYYNQKGNEYETGKFTHIYRPYVYDSSGKSTWGSLSYADGLLNLKVDDAWIKGATFPVYVDPSFGKTDIGATTRGFGTTIMYPSKYTLTEIGTITSITSYMSVSGGGFSVGALYEDTAGAASNLLASSNATAVANGIAWVTFTLNTPYVASAGDYWLGTLSSGTWYCRTDAGGNVSYKSGVTYPNLPNPYNGGATENYALSIYANYTVSGGSTAFNRSVTQDINLFKVPPTVTRHYTGTRLPTTGINVASSVDRMLEMTRGVTQSINLASDAIRSGINAYIRGVSLTFSTGSTTTRLATYFRGLSQNLDITTFNCLPSGGTPTPVAYPGNWTHYHPTNSTIYAGTLASGSVDNLTLRDGVGLRVDEINGSPCLLFSLNFTNIPTNITTMSLRTYCLYEGNPAHIVRWEAYNYTASDWDILHVMKEHDYEWINASMSLSTEDYNPAGNVTVRLNHVSNGAAGHYMLVDYAELKGLIPVTGTTITEHPSEYIYILLIMLTVGIIALTRRIKR